jgi:hypothetical protein
MKMSGHPDLETDEEFPRRRVEVGDFRARVALAAAH